MQDSVLIDLLKASPFALCLIYAVIGLWRHLIKVQEAHALERKERDAIHAAELAKRDEERKASQDLLLAQQRDSMASNNTLATALNGLAQEVRGLGESRQPGLRPNGRLKNATA